MGVIPPSPCDGKSWCYTRKTCPRRAAPLFTGQRPQVVVVKYTLLGRKGMSAFQVWLNSKTHFKLSVTVHKGPCKEFQKVSVACVFYCHIAIKLHIGQIQFLKVQLSQCCFFVHCCWTASFWHGTLYFCCSYWQLSPGPSHWAIPTTCFVFYFETGSW